MADIGLRMRIMTGGKSIGAFIISHHGASAALGLANDPGQIAEGKRIYATRAPSVASGPPDAAQCPPSLHG